jgi:hypothetical protein
VVGVSFVATGVGSGTGTAMQAVNPYNEADLRNVQVCQINNLIYLTHPSHPPQRLSRLSDTNWTVGEVPFGDPSIKNNWAPMLDQNVTTTTITPSATTGTAITLTASSNIFQAGHVGSYFELAHPNPTTLITRGLSSNGTSGTIEVLGKWSLQTFGTWTAQLDLEKSTDNGTTWTVSRTYRSEADYNATSSGEEDVRTLFRMTVSNASTGTSDLTGTTFTYAGASITATTTVAHGLDTNSNISISGQTGVNACLNGTWVCLSGTTGSTIKFRINSIPTGALSAATVSLANARAMLTPLDPTLRGLVRITGFTSATSVTARVLKPLGGTGATSQWREGAFSAVQGYPAAAALHDSRIIYAGTGSNPSSLWGSYSNDFQNFRQGAYDADSWFFTLASTTGGQIQWLVSKSALLIGTTLDEWSMQASDQTRPITPTNVNVRQQSHYGSSSVGAQIVNDTLLYVQRMNRKIREMDYTFSSENWVSNDITALAEHTTRTGIVETSYQRVPDAILWFVRGDGQLVSMTYEREQQVVGFARHITDGVVESVATLNGTNAEDEVWLLVRRTIGGATVRYVERLKLGMRDALDTADKSNWWYMDSGVLRTATTSTGKTTGNAGTYTSSPVMAADGITILSYTVTVTSSGHGLSTGNFVRITSASAPGMVSTFAVTVTGANTFTFSIPTLSLATGSLVFDFVTTLITGLSHLEGKAVSVWADNAVGSLIVTQPTVVGGQITLQIPASRVLVGLPFTSTLVPQRVDTNLQDGTSQGRRMRIPRINLKVYQSTGGELSTDGVKWFPLVSRTLTDVMDSSPPVLNGYERAYASSNWADGVDLYVRQTQPVPFTVAALVVNFEVSEATQN